MFMSTLSKQASEGLAHHRSQDQRKPTVTHHEVHKLLFGDFANAPTFWQGAVGNVRRQSPREEKAQSQSVYLDLVGVRNWVRLLASLLRTWQAGKKVIL